MTKPYHITQEQAGELWVETPAGETLESSLQAFANAALDKVLGEPVAEAFIDNFGDLKIYPTGIASKAILIHSGDTKLYAPRRTK